ncbi:CopG family transcriptional regulator [Salinirubrum litoreum]|uniref:CopG family transcriptional regulator n=1 Tax=Salinirubrum litoreum TaxID=1126234 RepID=A0ABD5R6T8_9EURY|nr:CopG family transcriptional regulator [Salinirubrum litoreum]
MSKITFRADDDLVRRLEEFDASKSEVMREALRAYLDAERGPSESTPTDTTGGTGTPGTTDATTAEEPHPGSLDAVLSDRIDELLAERLDAREAPVGHPARQSPEFTVNVSLDGVSAQNADASVEQTTDAESRKTRPANDDERPKNDPESARKTCGQCGENMGAEHVYCPNCGEKATHRVFCDCGDELRSDWAFCPGCGRRTPAADVLERS